MKKIISKYPWVLLSIIALAGCGEGAEDVSFDYDQASLTSENASNIYEEPPRAPEGYKVIYYVDAGDGTPGKLEVLETFGTRSSVEDQAYGPDITTGYSWGYTAEAAQYYADADKWGSIRGDERDTPGLGVEYAFELDEGSYTVVIGFDDPWDSEGTRHVDIVLDGNVVSEGFFIPAEAAYERFDNIEVTDGILELSVQRSASNSDGSADPQISWIEIWGDTDEEAAAPVQKIWISGEFQVNDWELSQAPEMKPEADNWYEMTVHFQDAGTFNFIDQTVNWNEYYGTDDNGNIVYSGNAGSMSVDAAGYYTIRFNLESLEYSVAETDLSDVTAQETMYIWGKGFPQYPEHDWWDESTSYYDIADAIPLTKNFNDMGEHVFGIQGLQFSEAVELQFVNSTDADNATQYGFTSVDLLNADASEFYWHQTAQEDWQYLTYNGAAGTYTLIFDYAVGRATLIKESTSIFMVGSGTPGDWDVSQAVELTPSEEWPGWYYIDIRFTNEDSGDAIKPYGDYKFVSEQSWNGDNYGLADVTVDTTTMENSGSSDGIPAPAPGYYTVWFEPATLTYEIYDLTTDNAYTEMFIVGKGYVDYPDLDWNPEAAIPMEINFQGGGDYVFGLECLEFGDAVDMKFLGQTSWEGLDVGFVIGGEQTAPVVWAQTTSGDGTADLKINGQAGFYDVTFDYLINRASVLPNNSGTCN
jgi:hypothetical protein